jgi:hypothetical protein
VEAEVFFFSQFKEEEPRELDDGPFTLGCEAGPLVRVFAGKKVVRSSFGVCPHFRQKSPKGHDDGADEAERIKDGGCEGQRCSLGDSG